MQIGRISMNENEQREWLNDILLAPDPSKGLWQACDSGLAATYLPELPALRLEQDPIHRHKDVLSHTIAVTAKTKPELTLRLSALFHDIGKPATRRIDNHGVTFRHHEMVGSKIARRRLKKLNYSEAMVCDVTELVRLSGRFKGYSEGWSDSAVRRYVKDAGPLLDLLNSLIRCDCTTRNKTKAENLQHLMDELEDRIALLSEQERKDAERPQMNGQEVMSFLKIQGGPEVGDALDYLLQVKRSEGVLPDAVIRQKLKIWWDNRS